MNRVFTGRHMLAITVGFFAVVVSVNLVMARFAITTFGGTTVDNSYVASNAFNRWLDEAHAQQALGWQLTAQRDGDHVLVRLTGTEMAHVQAAVIHPLGRAQSRILHFVQIAGGRHRSVEALPPGRWRLEIRVRAEGRQARFIDEVSA